MNAFTASGLPWQTLACLIAGAVVIAGLAAPLTKRPEVTRLLGLLTATAAGACGSLSPGSLAQVLAYSTAAFIFVVLLLALSFELEYAEQRPEAVALVLLAATGALVLAAGGDLLQLVIGTETLALSSALLVVLGRGDAAAEAAFKYFVLGAVSLAALIYGLALIYLSTGSLAFPTPSNISLMTVSGVVLMTLGFAFELALVPLHWGALDVYTAATPAAAGGIMALSKLGAVVALVRLAPAGGSTFTFVLAMIGLLSVVWATFAALGQREVRRLLAYSAVAHAGFLAMAIGSGTSGRQAAIFYVIVYGSTALLVFAALSGLGPEPLALDELPARLGVQRSLALCLGLMSLAGIPPLPGFWAKLALFGPAWRTLGAVPTCMGVLCAVLAAVYYLRPVPDLWNALRAPARRARATSGVALATATVLVLTVVPGFLWSMVAR
ncbi:MAG: hypothetical protein JOZ39_02495 [Chloroflexi bacterium]|nr:hypothetical protein [Chloroflexota bacterium]